MKTNAKTNSKRTLSLTVSGLLLVGLLAFGGLTAQAQETEIDQTQLNSEFDSTESDSNRWFFCSTRTLKGRYANISGGFTAPPPNTPLPFATVSMMTLDGAGNLTNKVTRSNNGVISRGVDTGTYTVNADCTGTITISTPNPPFQLTFDLVVAQRHGREFYFIATTPGGVVTTRAKRIQ